VLEGDDARAAVAEASRRTTSRRELERHDGFAEVSPEVGVLDESAFDELMESDPDAALSLLAELTGATDEGLRRLAHRLAGRVLVEVARTGAPMSSGVGKLRAVRSGDGEVDLDRSLDAIVAARAVGAPAHLDDLVTTQWGQAPTTVCLLVDRSGSMTGDRLASAAVAAAAVQLRFGERCSVVAFSSDAVVLSSLGEPREPEAVVGDLLRLRGHGTTDVELALRAAQEQLARGPSGRKVTVLLSDCRSTTGAPPDAAAAALDELVIVAPEQDLADAARLADVATARLVPVGPPSQVAAAVGSLLSARP
jgi:Mg-chelatase subunit ChlD